MPSYAQPIIGECVCGEEVRSSNAVWILPEYPNTEYWRLVSDSLKSISSPKRVKLLTVKLLTELSIINPDPLGVTFTGGDDEYPMPAFMTFTSVILPPLTTALNLPPMPVPIPTKSKSGADV